MAHGEYCTISPASTLVPVPERTVSLVQVNWVDESKDEGQQIERTSVEFSRDSQCWWEHSRKSEGKMREERR